jgi:RHS repeat-associated protein
VDGVICLPLVPIALQQPVAQEPAVQHRARTAAFRTHEFGRQTEVWDDLDSTDYPTVSFSYDWGGVPNQTVVSTRTAHDEPHVHVATACMDGFGREVERRDYYHGHLANRSRIDYDARGLKSVETMPVDAGIIPICPETPGPVFSMDRTVFRHDPLGNVVEAMSVPANETQGPFTTASHRGATTVFWDELFTATVHTRDVSNRTLTVSEGNNGIQILRAVAQGEHRQWGPDHGGETNYQRIADQVADDETYIYGWAWQTSPLDTHVYPSADLDPGAVIEEVRFHFRWRHTDTEPPLGGGGMWPIFRQADVDTRGPAYFRHKDEGWGDYAWVMTVNPRTGQAWSAEDLNAGIEFGFEAYPQEPASKANVSHAYVEVVTYAQGGPETVYQYDRLGQLVQVTDDAGNVTTIDYDLAGRKTSMNDPDMGSWSYGYNAAGSLTSQTDARAITTTLEYDAAQRLRLKTYSSGHPAVEYEYDEYPDTNLCDGAAPPVGLATRMTDGAGERLSCFDIRGRETTTRRTVDAAAYDVHREFHPLGSVRKLTYPDGEEVQYSAHAAGGQLASVSSLTHQQPLLSSVSYTPWHATHIATFGNGQSTTYGYDHRARITSIHSSSIQDVTFEYDDASNVKTVNDAGEVATYAYDELHRLTGMWLDGSPVASYTYNSIGNLLTKHEGASSLTLGYPAAGTARPHAATSISGTIDGGLKYDQNGNVAGSWVEDADFSHSYEFDAENRITGIFASLPRENRAAGLACADFNGDGVITLSDVTKIQALFGLSRSSPGFDYRADLNWSGAIVISDITAQQNHYGLPCPSEETRYVYDGEGNLLKRTYYLPNQAATSTVYIDGIYEEQDDGTVTKYYHALGRAIAMRTVPASGPDELHYLLSDHLGSTTKLLDDQGGVVSEVKYWPYGGMRDGGITETDKLYTGQQIEPSTTGLGLYNYKARFYSTTLGRFLSPDTLVVDGLNRYTYVKNNPMRYNDPTGRCVGGELVVLWNPCTMQPANYAPGTAGPLPMGPTVTCDGLCQALKALAAAGMFSVEQVMYRAALVYCHANPWHCAPTPIVTSRPPAPVEASGGGSGGRFGRVVGGVTSAASIGSDLALAGAKNVASAAGSVADAAVDAGALAVDVAARFATAECLTFALDLGGVAAGTNPITGVAYGLTVSAVTGSVNLGTGDYAGAGLSTGQALTASGHALTSDLLTAAGGTQTVGTALRRANIATAAGSTFYSGIRCIQSAS